MSFLQIPGNIKQQFLPFVLNNSEEAWLNRPAASSTDLGAKKGSISPQFFSYRDTNVDYSSGKAKLQFYPSSLNNILINDDISYKLLYSLDENGEFTQNSLTIKDILNAIPGISIREFLPDTRLDQCINMFKDLMGNLSKLTAKDDSKSQSSANPQQTGTKDELGLFEKITAAAEYTIKYMVAATNPNFYDDLALTDTLPFKNYDAKVYNNTKASNETSPGYSIMTFPYTLYYRLQSCVTTNVYEVPGAIEEKRILYGNGSAGWTSGSDAMSTGEMRISNLLGKIPGIGTLANMVLGNIGINYMPWWNAESGTKTREPEITIKFDLYNDTEEAAMNNFIFVNTIVPSNRWVQYNMFQHSSNLYDVKIEGLNRLYACAGDFEVAYDGVLRNPPRSWIQKLVSEHLNANMDYQAFLNSAVANKLIKIPDVYKVQLKFTSLLPANFNNYIFAYAENINHMAQYKDHVYDESVLANALPNAVSKYFQRVAEVFKTGNPSAGGNVKFDNAKNDKAKK